MDNRKRQGWMMHSVPLSRAAPHTHPPSHIPHPPPLPLQHSHMVPCPPHLALAERGTDLPLPCRRHDWPPLLHGRGYPRRWARRTTTRCPPYHVALVLQPELAAPHCNQHRSICRHALRHYGGARPGQLDGPGDAWLPRLPRPPQQRLALGAELFYLKQRCGWRRV